MIIHIFVWADFSKIQWLHIDSGYGYSNIAYKRQKFWEFGKYVSSFLDQGEDAKN